MAWTAEQEAKYQAAKQGSHFGSMPVKRRQALDAMNEALTAVCFKGTKEEIVKHLSKEGIKLIDLLQPFVGIKT